MEETYFVESLMTRKLLLWISAFLTLFTCLGHSTGGIAGPGPDQAEAFQVYKMMQMTFETMPIGSPKSILTIMMGNSICVSFFLLVSGLMFVILSKGDKSKTENKILFCNSFGMLAVGVVSFFCFFPIPAIFTGLAGILGFVSLKR